MYGCLSRTETDKHTQLSHVALKPDAYTHLNIAKPQTQTHAQLSHAASLTGRRPADALLRPAQRRGMQTGASSFSEMNPRHKNYKELS